MIGLNMKLVERRETIWGGQPQIKLTFVGNSGDEADSQSPCDKLTLYVSAEDDRQYFEETLAGDYVQIQIKPIL